LIRDALLVGCGGFLGAVARYLVGAGVGRLWRGAFPLGTFVINVSGSFILGLFGTWVLTRGGFPQGLRLAVATGFVGAYTTFSTLEFEALGLFSRGRHALALGYVLGSLVAGFGAVALGARLADARLTG
jgi:CrcB protein